MLQLWEKGTCLSELLEPGKRPGECPKFSSWRTHQCLTCWTCSHTCTHQLHSSHTWTAKQEHCDHIAASCSVLSKDHMSPPVARTKLVYADGRNITPCDTTTLTVTLGPFSTEHSFIVVEHLSVPAILGCDFLREHGFVLNFESGTYYRADSPNQALPQR